VKLDSSILKQLIKEELQNLLQEQYPAAERRKREKKAAREAKNQAEVDRGRKEKKAAVPYNPKHSETPAEREKRLRTEKPTTTKKAETKETTEKSTEETEAAVNAAIKKCNKEKGKYDWGKGLCTHPGQPAGGDKKDDKKSTFTREQGSLRRKINQLKKDGKIDEKTWRAARKALYKGTDAANAVLQKAGVGGRAPRGLRTAGDAGGQYRRAQQPLTPQEHATAKRLWDAVQTLIAEKHPQLQNIWRAIVRAAQGGHKIARVVVGEMADQRKRDQKIRDRRTQVTQATQTRPGIPGLS